MEFVEVRNPDELKVLVETAGANTLQSEGQAAAVLSADGSYVWAGQFWRLAVFSPDGSWVWDGRYWRSGQRPDGPALLPPVRDQARHSVPAPGGPRSGSGMGGFIVGGVVLVFGLMELI